MDLHWYVIYTKKDAEAKLRNGILDYYQKKRLDYQVYLPLKTEVKQWSDRKKTRETPLFRNYLFVRHDINGFHPIKIIPGFGDYIRFGKYPSIIPEQEINLIKTVIANHQDVSCKPKRLVRGDKVRICKGSLAEYEGILIEDQSKRMVAIEIKNLKLCLQVHVPLNDIIRI